MPITPPGQTTNFQYSVLSQSYAVNAATNTHASYPATNLLDLTRPRLYTRSTSTTAPVITLDIGTSMDIMAFSIENINFESLVIEGSDNNSTWPSSVTVSTDTMDIDDQRRKYIIIPTVPFPRRYIRLTPSSLDAGETFYHIGSFGMWPTLTSLNKNFSRPYEKAIEDDAEESNDQVGVNAPIRVRVNLTARVTKLDLSSNEQFAELVTAPRNRVILLFENEGDNTKMYHMRRDASARITRNADGLNTISGLQLREVG